MSIIYFPNRTFKKNSPAIDRVMAQRSPQLIRGRTNVASNALSEVISCDTNWHLNAIKFTFSNVNSRSYSAKILGGVKVVQNLNDYLWFMMSGILWQKITLTPGFYTGTQLATELQTRLTANTAFTAAGKTFTVVYSDDTGLFTITPSSGTVRYIQTNTFRTISDKDSIAGHLFGLTQDTVFASSITSNTPVFGLNQEAWIIDEDDAVVTEHYNDDIHVLSMDQALHLTSNVANVSIDYEIQFEEIV
jgi:hypothetical protein